MRVREPDLRLLALSKADVGARRLLASTLVLANGVGLLDGFRERAHRRVRARLERKVVPALPDLAPDGRPRVERERLSALAVDVRAVLTLRAVIRPAEILAARIDALPEANRPAFKNEPLRLLEMSVEDLPGPERERLADIIQEARDEMPDADLPAIEYFATARLTARIVEAIDLLPQPVRSLELMAVADEMQQHLARSIAELRSAEDDVVARVMECSIAELRSANPKLLRVAPDAVQACAKTVAEMRFRDRMKVLEAAGKVGDRARHAVRRPSTRQRASRRSRSVRTTTAATAATAIEAGTGPPAPDVPPRSPRADLSPSRRASR